MKWVFAFTSSSKRTWNFAASQKYNVFEPSGTLVSLSWSFFERTIKGARETSMYTWSYVQLMGRRSNGTWSGFRASDCRYFKRATFLATICTRLYRAMSR